MSDAGEQPGREGAVEAGLTREELLRRAAAGGAALVAGGALAGAATGAPAAPAIKRGGVFRLGIAGAGAQDFIDGQHIVAKSDIARLVATFEGLAYFNEQYKPTLDGLAEELEAEKANQWLIRVRSGIEFHNGKTLTADDVIYSIRRTLNPKLGLFGRGGFSAVDPNNIRKLDNRTVRLFLKEPDVTLIDSFCQYFQGIVPVNYSPNGLGTRTGNALRFVGTGPYKVKTFIRGRQSIHVRNENYWRTGQPYFDEVRIINFPDDTARVNALLSGQVDAIVDLPYAQIPVARRRGNLKILESPTGAWNPISMRLDTAPFNDVRVRRAMRLLANRQQMVQQALAGHGRVANDLYSPFDLCYAGDEFPQRRYDPEQARSLLKQAGQEGLTVDLQTTAADTGMVEIAQILAQNAKAAGVTINVKNLDGGTFYGDQYLQWPFATDYWGTRNYLAQVSAGSLKESPFNESHWDSYQNYDRFVALYKQAKGSVDLKKRCELIKEMQRMEYNDGGHIIVYFKNLTDAYSNKVGGFKVDRGTLNLNKYGNGFRTIYFV
jgi:peptide/nickel transport system substrate-binding protein